MIDHYFFKEIDGYRNVHVPATVLASSTSAYEVVDRPGTIRTPLIKGCAEEETSCRPRAIGLGELIRGVIS